MGNTYRNTLPLAMCGDNRLLEQLVHRWYRWSLCQHSRLRPNQGTQLPLALHHPRLPFTLLTPTLASRPPTAMQPKTFAVTMHDNRLYADSPPSVTCGSTYSFKDWLAFGLDKGTTLAAAPDAATIIQWAKQLLSF